MKPILIHVFAKLENEFLPAASQILTTESKMSELKVLDFERIK